MRHTTQSSSEQDKKTTWKWSKWREKERFDLISRDKNRHCESIDNRSQRGLKNGLQTDRQTKYIFIVWQTLSFQSREQFTVNAYRKAWVLLF